MATYTPPVIHSTGEVLAVTDWNGVANDIVWLAQRPYFNYYNSLATTIAASFAATQVTLGGTTAAGYGFSVSSNNVIAPLTGTYSISGGVQFISSGSTSFGFALIYHNGTAVAQGAYSTLSVLGADSTVSTVISCAAGDNIGLWASQGGGTLPTQAGAATTFLSGFFLGSQ